MPVSLSLDLVNTLDIHVSQMTGFLQDARYDYLMEEYELDSTQCLLWWEISQLLAEILQSYDFEEVSFDEANFGLEIKKILAIKAKKFTYVIQLLQQHDVLHDNLKIGKVIKEAMDDIEAIYQSIEKDLSKLLTSQKKIQSMVEEDYEIEEIEDED
ncbi:MAG: hypothetical protein HUU50_07855 [Candidatus Brocadiae bacterium]|nr:hypothetical protein [Candidatus Brocadiia bacterium]